MLNTLATSETVYAIVEDYQLPLGWGTFHVTIEARASYKVVGQLPGYQAGGYTRFYDDFELDPDTVEIWSADGGSFIWSKVPAELKTEIERQFEAAQN